MKRRSQTVKLFHVGRFTRLGTRLSAVSLLRDSDASADEARHHSDAIDGEENDVQHRLLSDSNGQRTAAVILETGDEVQAFMKTFIEAEGIRAAQVPAIGAFSDAELLYFDWKSKKYHKSAIAEQLSVANCRGFTGHIASSLKLSASWRSASCAGRGVKISRLLLAGFRGFKLYNTFQCRERF